MYVDDYQSYTSSHDLSGGLIEKKATLLISKINVNLQPSELKDYKVSKFDWVMGNNQ